MTCNDTTKFYFSGTEWKFVFQGAESRVFEGEYGSKSAILKERFPKRYRLQELDIKLTKERIKSEIRAYKKLAEKCKNIFDKMPRILYSDDRNIIFTKIENTLSLNDYIIECEQNENQYQIEQILIQLAYLIADIHSIGLIHGDLTTCNFLFKKTNDNSTFSLIPIDFGLSFSSTSDEDRAVDLYVLERAIQSSHPNLDFEIFLNFYQERMGTDTINKKLDQVRMRGRKRLLVA